MLTVLRTYIPVNGILEIMQGNGTDAVSDADPVISTQYYDLFGKEVKYLRHGHIYMVKEIRQSGKTTVKKIIEKRRSI